jgi:hypothetical protein
MGKRRFRNVVFSPSHDGFLLLFFFFTEAVAVLSLVLTPFFQNYLFVGATSVPVSRGLGSTERDAWFGGSVDTLIRNIMIFSNINLLDTRL